jgi:sugar phosphate permease
MAGPIAHPLINDYVRKNSRGKAIALNGLGQVFGDVLAMGGLLNVSRSMTYGAAFALTAAIIVGWAVFFFIFVKDPSLERIAARMDRQPTRR